MRTDESGGPAAAGLPGGCAAKEESRADAPKVVTDPELLRVPQGTWLECDVKLWQCKCHLFVGPMDMLSDSLARTRDEASAMNADPRPEMPDEALKFAKRWVENHIGERTDGDAFGDGVHCFIRLSGLCVGELDDMAILMHECLHAASGILRDTGVNDEEALAYTQEFLFKEFMGQAMESRGLKPIGVK